jgi:predicted dehydrogenase
MAKTMPPVPDPAVIPRDVSLGLTNPKDVAFPLRWGIIGAGEISRQFVLSSKAVPGANMAAVFSRSREKAEAFAESYGVAKAYNNLGEMLASSEIDIVYIGTPQEIHKEHSIMALNAGKHVLCEKALTESLEDAKEMYAAAEKNNVMLQDGVWPRFFPALEHARNLIESNAIGDVLIVQADFDPFYTLQAVTLAFGIDAKPIDIKVSGKAPGPGGAILEFENNRFANLTFIAYPSEFPEVTEITGTKGRITLEQPAHCPTSLTVRIPPITPSRYMRDNTPSPSQRFDYPLPSSVNVPRAFVNQQGFIYMIEAIHRCLAAGLLECPQFNKQDSLHLMEILQGVLKYR